MNLDIESIKQAISAFSAAIIALKQAKDLLPEGKKKEEIVESIENAERQIKIAEAQIAHSMGYEICRNHFPPEVMLSADDENWVCTKCKTQKNTGPSGGFSVNYRR